MTFEQVIDRRFPGSMPEEAFVRRSAVTLIRDHGFGPGNTLACVGVCRDELCRTLTHEVEAMWGDSFDLSALAGMLTLGRFGFSQIRSHAPVMNGRSRLIFLLFSHIGIGPGGELGTAERAGQSAVTPTCGALVALFEQLQSGGEPEDLEWREPELGLVQKCLLQAPGVADSTDLIELTIAAHNAALSQLETVAGEVFDPRGDDYAVLAGVQIHSQGGTSRIWPGAAYVVVEGRRSEMWF